MAAMSGEQYNATWCVYVRPAGEQEADGICEARLRSQIYRAASGRRASCRAGRCDAALASQPQMRHRSGLKPTARDVNGRLAAKEWIAHCIAGQYQLNFHPMSM